MNTKTLSAQMLDVLWLLDRDGPMTARQLNDRLYQPSPPHSPRVFSASMSRTIRRLERRGITSREGGTIAITQRGRFTRYSEVQEKMLTELRASVRQAVAEVLAQVSQKPTVEKGNEAASDGLAG